MIVDQPVVLSRIRHGLPILDMSGQLLWDETDPAAVTLVIEQPGRGVAVAWEVGRDLLTAGLHGPIGDGDIQVAPHPEASTLIQIDLTSNHGSARFTVSRHTLGEFLHATWQIVDAEAEDDMLAAELESFDWAAPARVLDDTEGTL